MIADSVSESGDRLTTMEMRYPRYFHSEFLTHRAFSRNASSTRAIPLKLQIKWVEEDPAIPVYWGKNQRGMQATSELSEEQKHQALSEWLAARDDAVEHAKEMDSIGLHKQIAGRIIEPWAHIVVIVSGTTYGWHNFFGLRCHKDALPDIQVLAVNSARLYRDHTPTLRTNWGKDSLHLPYVLHSERDSEEYGEIDLIAMSVARCARVSYTNHDGTNPNFVKDLQLHDDLIAAGHMSPTEHQGLPAYGAHGNFEGWMQYRKTLVNECRAFDFNVLEAFGDECFIV